MIQLNEDNSGFGENVPDPEEIRERYPIEDDSDTLEPFVDEYENREINTDDPEDIIHWAQEFQISVDDLKSAIVLNGNSVKEIKKYLSV
ncbi:DUF3606 domain-containing protein [Pedobacter boryungensis]|uniref:DUF3606 domain-containing protein n=1 Tax=Pedobacter boryungensis TaxID=869962 RepID=A0ABX2DBC9_9SPHI|nr:DUF3606 domain-containing protein [Pedobacter boryungensis]NQX30636.1 DUF3606 domain-containing protein [Pedobacter boryungensis]